MTAAARALALEHGLDEVTVEMICNRAGVSVRTFFNYFESKDMALLGPAPELADTTVLEAFRSGGPTGNLLADLLEVIAGPDPEELDKDNLRQMFDVLEREPRLLAAHLTRHLSLERQAAELVAERLGLDEPDARCGLAAALAFTVLRQAGRRWFHQEPADSGVDGFVRARHEIHRLAVDILADSDSDTAALTG